MLNETTCYFCGRMMLLKNQCLKVLGRAMCKHCEDFLVWAPVEDRAYEEFKDKIKNLWLTQH